MKHSRMREWKCSLIFSAFIFLGLTKVYAQPASKPPVVKYLINNYSSIAKAASCDTCAPFIAAPLKQFRPIPFPEAGPIQYLTGVDVSAMPGLMTPNFWGGGSPEIKGYMKRIAGKDEDIADIVRGTELLFFKGAQGVAISKASGTIYTSAPTVTIGAEPKNAHGIFTFKSTPAIMPRFNEISEKKFEQSPTIYKVYNKDGGDPEEIVNKMKETVYFAIDPNNEKIMYASMINPADTTERGLFRKNGDDGWYLLDWSVGGVLTGAVWGALTVDNDGNLYIADPNKNIIVKAAFDYHGNASSWKIIAGTIGTAGFKDDEDGLQAEFNRPSGICIDNNTGNIYIGDAGNNRVRKIDNDGEVTTYAGTGAAGFVDDNSAFDAKFNSPTAVAYNEMTKSLFVVDYNNNMVREIDKDQHVTTLAGNPGKYKTLNPAKIAMQFYYVLAKLNLKPDEAKLDRPSGIAIDPSGHGLYVSDHNYISYVSTFPAKFVRTSAFRDLDSTQLPLPILPLGLEFDEDNGAIWGIPLMPWPATTYTISVLNSRGESVGLTNGFITIEVVACPEKTDTVVINKTITLKELPYTWNGQRLDSAGTVAISNTTKLGCDSVTVLNLSISPGLAYSAEPYILSVGQQIKQPILPTTAGSIITTFSVTPPLPDGLVLNAQTGAITGTPLATTSGQNRPVVGPQTLLQYPAPWTLKPWEGADLTEFKISDGNGKTLFENNSAFNALTGTAGEGTGSPGAYTDFSSLGPIKMYSNNPYTVRLGNALYTPGREWENLNYTRAAREYWNFMNSFAVYIDYNRDGDFEEANERVYISAAPQTPAHAESFALNIPVTATAGVTKMRIYAVEAQTTEETYWFDGPNYTTRWVDRTTEQALSFYPFYKSISDWKDSSGIKDFQLHRLDHGEFEDYAIDIVSPVTESYVVTGSNAFGSAQSTVKFAIARPTTSSTNLTICSNQFPYRWNKLIFWEAGTQTDTLRNSMGADSLATLNLSVKQISSSRVEVAHCGPYTYLGKEYRESGTFDLKIPNAAGCDSLIRFVFRQKATASTTHMQLTPNDLPFTWNDKIFKTAGTQSDTLTNKEGCDSIATLVLRVQYNIAYKAINTLTINKPIEPINPQVEGNYTFNFDYAAHGYGISPALPAGLQIDYFTGAIAGTPTQVSPLQTYRITSGQNGAQPTTLQLSVGEPSVSTNTINNCGPLTWNGVVYDKAITTTFSTKNQYGFDSTATLILTIRDLSSSTTILNLNPAQLPYKWNGDSITKEGLDTVHLVNAVGCDSAAIADVVVSPKFWYPSPQILGPNALINPINPQNLGGIATNFTIQPSLVRGLHLDAATGVISGTATDTLLQPVTYTIRAINRAGADTAQLVIAVCNTMATSFTKDICDQYIWNDSTYTESTIHTRTLKNRGGCDSVVTMNLIIRKGSTGATTTVVACSNYAWYGKTYDTTGVYTKVFPNAVGCDSTLTLNLTVNYPSVNNLYVNLNASDLPYKWRNKTFTAPGSDTVLLRNGNSVGCDSTVRMTVRISAMLPDITYATKDTLLYWEQRIETPIAMSNTGTPVPAMKLGERDTVVKFSGGPGDHLRNTLKGRDGAYYASIAYNTKIHKLDSSGKWAEFVDLGSQIAGMAMDSSGNLYAGTSLKVVKITPDRVVSDFGGVRSFISSDALAVDADNNLIVAYGNIDKLLTITKYNLSTESQVGQMRMDHSPYFSYSEIDIEADSKGNMYISPRMGSVILKIKSNGHISSIGQAGSGAQRFQQGNGPDALIPEVYSMALDRSNDNVYLMAGNRLIRVDTAENVTQITGPWFDLWRDHIFRVDTGKAFIINNTTATLSTANVYGVGSLPFMDNYGASGVNDGTVNFSDFDKRLRLDSSGSIVGTPRATYSSIGTKYGSNRTTGYAIIAANQHGISTAPMTITTKDVYYKKESFVTTTLPFHWRGRSFYASTDTAKYFIANRLEASDTIYMLHLVYEGPPVPFITSTCAEGGFSLAVAGAAKSAISFDGTTTGLIKNVERSGGSMLPYFGADWTKKPDGSTIVYFSSAFEVWIKPKLVDGTQYLLTRDTVKTNGTFFGYSIQDGKFVYEFTKGTAPFVNYKLVSDSSIKPNVWTHVAASFYDSAMYIFINGKLAGKQQTADRFLNIWHQEAPGSAVFISPDFTLAGLGSQLRYTGEMDELRLWGARRTVDSVKADMYNIVDPKRKGLGLYYRFDGDVTDGVMDISMSGRRAVLTKPATSVDKSGAPINFASHKWMPGGETTKSIVVNPTSNTVYSVMVKDYKDTMRSASLLVYPAQGPSITAPAAIARINTPTSCGVVVTDAELGAAIATDNCPGVMVKRIGVPAGNLFPLGVTTITYTAVNLSGLTKSATQTVTITDHTKPAFTTNLSADLVAIWPPDHRLKNVTLTYGTADNCGTVKNIVTVTSTDAITGMSDGDKSPDWIISNDHLVQLRAERGNGKEARVYTITVTPVDSSGNVGIPQSVNVYIAHNITTPITGSSFKIGSTVDFSGVFWDKQGNRHTGEWVIDDNTVVKGIVTEPSGTRNGKVTGSYKFTTAGTYKLRMNITDQNRVTSYCNTHEDMEAIVVIYDPAGGYTVGGGWFISRPGALPSNPAATGKVSFGFQSNYYKGATFPKGETQLEFKVGELEFNALNFEYLAIAGAKAQFKGSGKIIGDQSGYGFIMTVIDGQINGSGVDKIRMKIFNKNTGKIIYDNQPGASDAADPTEVVGAGSVVTITGTNTNTTAKSSIALAEEVAEVVMEKGLRVQVLPNPSYTTFTLLVASGSTKPVDIRIVDGLGRTIEARSKVAANGALTLGYSYATGVYYAEVVQGAERKVVKLVKVSE